MKINATSLLLVALLSQTIPGTAAPARKKADTQVSTTNNSPARQLGSISHTDGHLLWHLPEAVLGREFLVSSSISRTTDYKLLGVGTRSRTRVVTLAEENGQVFLKEVNSDILPLDGVSPLPQAMRNSHLDRYLANLPVTERSEGTITLDATNLFLTDTTLSPFSWRTAKNTGTLDKSLTTLQGFKVFDDNLSVRAVFSYRFPAEGRSDARVVSAETVHSLLLLPEDKMRPRLADERIGLFTEGKVRYDPTVHDLYDDNLAVVDRWRVEPADWEAWRAGKLVEPKQHITYYIDSNFPESWKQPIREGILAWNVPFAEIGLKDVVQVRDYPADDPEFDEDNLKYSCIRYIPTDRGGSQGPSWADPRTGELLSASVYVWGLLQEDMNKYAFAQTAQANTAIRSGRLSQEQWAESLRQILAHEVGHTLGLAHNMGGSAAYPIDSLLTPGFVERHGLTASVMDYIYFNFLVPPGATNLSFSDRELGPYDHLVLKYIYNPTAPQLSPYEDKAIASTWIDEHFGDPLYRYGEQQWGDRLDPTTVIYDIGDDDVRAGTLAVENMKYVLAHMNEWLARPDQILLRKEYYDELVKQYGIVLGNVLINVGGVKLWQGRDYKAGGRYEPISSDYQRQALQWVAAELRGAHWIDDGSVTAQFVPTTRASAELAQGVSRELLKTIGKVSRSARLAGESAYTQSQFAADVYRLFFLEPSQQGALTEAVKALQLALAEAAATTTDNEQKAWLLGLMADVKPLAQRQAGAKTADRGHWLLLLSTVEKK